LDVEEEEEMEMDKKDWKLLLEEEWEG